MRYTPQIDDVREGRFTLKRLVRVFTHGVKWPVMAIILLYLYLAFHAFSGSQGIVNWMNNDSKTRLLNTKLEVMKDRREALEAQVEALDASHLDLDALDYAAREILFYSDPNDLTIWLDPKG